MDEEVEFRPLVGGSWPFVHAPRGTCIPGCELYGSCHCGCGDAAKLVTLTYERGLRVRGRPSVFRAGHHARVFPRQAGHWSKRGVPVERIRPLLAWLHERHGTWRVVAELAQIPIGTLKGYANNRVRRNIPPEAARRIQRLVLAHRDRPSLLDQWETKPGLRSRSPWWRETASG